MISKLDFIKSRRFWGLVVVAIIGVLNAEGVLGGEITEALKIIIWGFIGIRTVDKVLTGK